MPATSTVPQRSTSRHVLFNVVINDLEKVTHYPFIELANDSKVGDTVSMVQSRDLEVLDRPEEQPISKGLLLRKICGS